MPSLLAVTILHRHGSRGPGASELTPWNDDHPVVSQWKDHERENLSSIGRNQGKMLGVWYAQKYGADGLLNRGSGRVFWRCSKSDRGKESGEHFVQGFNETMGRELVGPQPSFYSVDADNYFRPWKVYKDKADAIKEKMNTTEWAAKVEENREFLIKIFQLVGAKESMTTKLAKALWANTYLYAIQEVEEYWPNNEEDERKALSALLTKEHSDKIVELALWVWEQRFLHSGCQIAMGGRICAEMLERTLNLEYSLNIYSGHDYTILGVLSVLKLQDKFMKPMSYGGFVLFELWDSSPTNPETHTGPVIRILFNPDPFKKNDEVSDVVNEGNLHYLGELNLHEVTEFLDILRAELATLPLKPLKVDAPPETAIDMLS